MGNVSLHVGTVDGDVIQISDQMIYQFWSLVYMIIHKLWKKAGAFIKPKVIMFIWYSPSGVLDAVNHSCPSLIQTTLTSPQAPQSQQPKPWLFIHLIN